MGTPAKNQKYIHHLNNYHNKNNIIETTLLKNDVKSSI